MPKISEIFSLGKSQHELDFVNINPNKDIPVYLNPFIFSVRTDPFSVEASRTIQGFFQHNLDLIKSGLVDEARANFVHLNEPNETCFGTSKGRPRGNGMGDDNANEVFDSILNSRAISTGLVDHLENTAIFISGIGRDKVSDMTTNIIRSNLIRYTQAQCDLLGIPLRNDVPSGFYWNSSTRNWNEELTQMLVIGNRKILLVPKAVVSYVKEFDHGKYHQHFALEFLQDDHLKRNTTLVQTTYNKNGTIRRRFVTKKDLSEKELSLDKEKLLEFTKKHPQVFKDFRNNAASQVVPIPNSEFDPIDVDQLINHLIKSLKTMPTGGAKAHAYHLLMIGILEFIFYPNLINPFKEREINEGRKRIDISFDNGAPARGFFHRLQHAFGIPCRYIPVECKNYSDDIENPELDQMVGRMSPNTGKFGIIVCREIENERHFLKRCSDSYKAQHGLIVPLTDVNIIEILLKRGEGVDHFEDDLLADKARTIMQG